MKKEYLWEVEHPDFRAVKVPAVDKYGAVMAACQAWGAESEWSWIAAGCTVKKLGAAVRPKCRRCGRPFGELGDAAGMCMECQWKERQSEREKREVFRRYDAKRKRERYA